MKRSSPSSPPSNPPRSPVSPLPQQAQKSEFARFIAGFGYAFHGLGYALRTQRNARVHCVAAILAIALGIYLHLSTVDFALIFMVIAGVFVTEMLNTVLEICVDLASPDYHPLAKIAKDVAAGAVLLCAILAVIVALLIFGPPLWMLLFH
jgi:diacylglycerol kinase